MKKKRYIKPEVTIVNAQTYGAMLNGSFTDWADSKDNSHGTSLWADEEEEETGGGTNWAGYQDYHQGW